jgi:hypothetical protein
LDRIGTILYNGGYRPEWHNIPFKPPHQNFTVTIPKATLPGKAELSVIHFTLVGVGYMSCWCQGILLNQV